MAGNGRMRYPAVEHLAPARRGLHVYHGMVHMCNGPMLHLGGGWEKERGNGYGERTWNRSVGSRPRALFFSTP